jgi:fumarate reductase (CoM/CoB) subunit A
MMQLNVRETISTDVLVIGGGGAGLRAAIEARERGAAVVIASTSRVGYGSNTAISGGAFGAALESVNPADSPALHLADTLRGGYFLSRPELASLLAADAPRQVAELARCGVKYLNNSTLPWLAFSSDPGHTYFRDVFGENCIGTDFSLPLRRHAAKIGVKFIEGVLVTRLLKTAGDVTGALALDAKGDIIVFAAAATVLASGGLGQLYRHHDNAAGTSGDGYLLALEAGATIADMEFVQSYPTGLNGGPATLYYECLFLETGGKLLNRAGEDIALKHGLTTPMVLTRDRLSQAIAKEMADATDPDEMVTADLSGIPEARLKILAPVLPKAAARGARQFPTVPTVHTQIGGVTINRETQTGVPGLYAAGEVAGGIHGANRLGGNALTEAWVFGAIAGRQAAAYAGQIDAAAPPAAEIMAEKARLAGFTVSLGTLQANATLKELQDLMWRQAGLVRSDNQLRHGLEGLKELREKLTKIKVESARDLHRRLKLDTMTRAAEMIILSALERQESRGCHYRTDYPETDDVHWLAHVNLHLFDGKLQLTTEKVTPGAALSG